tara:strand:+ start:61953 stop:62831 length:879 start_codon:yes stop_codon:yes gene_type:complete
MGGPSEEHNVSKNTGIGVASACRSIGYNVQELYFRKNYKNLLKDLKNSDIVFNALHGGIGENGKIQKWMSEHKIKFTGSGSKASQLCMDKSASKKFVQEKGFKTLEWQVLTQRHESPKIEVPFVVKPNDQGSTLGLTIVKRKNDIVSAIDKAFNFSSSVIIEKYLRGKELTVTILGEMAYPVVEIIPKNEYYDYECKYTPGMSDYLCPAKISDAIKDKIQSDTKKIFSSMDCEVYARADYIMDQLGKYYFLEMNTLPGLTSTSLVPKAVSNAGINYTELIKQIIELSLNNGN